MVPVANPDSREPKAQHIRIAPVNGSTAASVANATTATSIPPKIAPERSAGHDDRKQETDREPVRAAVLGVPRRDRRLGAPLDRQREGANQPDHRAHPKPEPGWMAVARKVTSTGPTMKTTSSSTASTRERGVEQGRVAPAGGSSGLGRTSRPG